MEIAGFVEHQRSESLAFDSQETVYFNVLSGGGPGTTQWAVRSGRRACGDTRRPGSL